MIKNLKLNIKNAQLAEVLQRQTSPESEKSPVAKARPKKADAAAPTVAEPAKASAKAVGAKAPAVRKPKPKADVAAVSEEAPAPAPKRARILRETPAISEAVKPEEKIEPPKESVQEPIFQEPIFDKPAEPVVVSEREVEASTPKKVQRAPQETKAPAQEAPSNSFEKPHTPQMGQKPAPMQGPREPYRGPSFTRQGSAPGSRPSNWQERGPQERFQPRDSHARPGSDRFGADRPRGYGDGSQRPRPDYRPGGPRPEGTGYPPAGARGPASADSHAPRGAPGAPFKRPTRPMEMRESFSERQARVAREQQERFQQQHGGAPERPRLGPTGRHFRDLVTEAGTAVAERAPLHTDQEKAARAAAHGMRRKEETALPTGEVDDGARGGEGKSRNTFDRSKPSKAIKKTVDRVRIDTTRVDEDSPWRKRRPVKRSKSNSEDLTIRPTSLHVRIPILVKDLAQEMKLKASQLISKLFLQGSAVTLNDVLDDETTIQLLGHEFGCEITIDTKEDERIRITSKSVAEEIQELSEEESVIRPPIVAFMGHVDHGKTSLTDAIRKSNRVAGEAGAITQHIGAFSCHTEQGDLTILDTPGHEAFTAMRERGAQVTDVIVLVVAGDEGIKPQTDEAIRHAKEVNATILVAINKCDKPTFNADTVYRQLAERELLPEAWGGKTITVNCSAVTGEGLTTLLEMIALQAEVLELKANPNSRARGSVIEAELHKGLGNVATVLVQNGTLRHGDALVFTQSWGRVKTMRDEFGQNISEAKPSQAVRITGLSSLPEAGEDFIVVANEKEARDIAETRAHQIREKHAIATRKKFSMEALLQHGQPGKKIFNAILRADVQGSVEALRFELLKIKSDKIDLNIVSEGIGEISESDVQLAAASGAVIIGFHSRIEAHAESLIKQHDVKVRCFDVIYHAVDGVRELMVQQLDKIAEEHPRGKAQVLAVFKSSQLGKIAGCQVIDGTILRSYRARVSRAGSVIWDGAIASLKRGKEDVREVVKGIECGILLNGFNDWVVDDIIETYEIIYRVQSL